MVDFLKKTSFSRRAWFWHAASHIVFLYNIVWLKNKSQNQNIIRAVLSCAFYNGYKVFVVLQKYIVSEGKVEGMIQAPRA